MPNPIHAHQNLVNRTQTKVHAPASVDSDYYLCRPIGRKGQHGPPVSWDRTDSPVTCKACLAKLHPVNYLHEPGLITAWIGEGDPYDPSNDRSAVLATATLFRQTEGATFSGWVVRTDRGQNYTDPIRRRAEALSVLRDMAVQEASKFADILER